MVTLPEKRVPDRYAKVMNGLREHIKLVDAHFIERESVLNTRTDTELAAEIQQAEINVKLATEFADKEHKRGVIVLSANTEPTEPTDVANTVTFPESRAKHVFIEDSSMIINWVPPAYALALNQDMRIINGIPNLNVAYVFVKMTCSTEKLCDISLNFLHKYCPNWTVNCETGTKLLSYNSRKLSILYHLYNMETGVFADAWHRCSKCGLIGSHVIEDCIYYDIYIAVIISATINWNFGDWISLYHLLVEAGKPKDKTKRLLSLVKLHDYDKRQRETLSLHEYLKRFSLF